MHFEVKKKLEKYEQEHLLQYYDELSKDQQEELLKQISCIDFSVIDLIKDRDEEIKKGKIEPITDAVTIEEIEKKKEQYYGVGIKAIKNYKIGAVLLAGGQGTRLGFDAPKGMYNIGIHKEVFIFERLVKNLMEVVRAAKTWVPLLIMTSDKNDAETRAFFKEKDYFGYNKDFIFFFVQDMAPSVDFDGKVYMEDKAKISMSPNGNGGWFSSLVRSGLLEKVKNIGVEWLNVFAVDNVLQKIADPYFVGATIESGCPAGSKVVRKSAPDEKVGVLCKEDGHPSIVEYYELTDEMRDAKNESGEPAYNYGVILNYLFKVTELEDILDKKLPLHIVEKKIPYMDGNGNFITPGAVNGFKFEMLVLDMIRMLDNCLAYEVVRNKEFAPVKNRTGVDSVDTARQLLIENQIEL